MGLLTKPNTLAHVGYVRSAADKSSFAQAAAQGYQVPVSAPAPSQEAPAAANVAAAPSSGTLPQASAAPAPPAAEGGSGATGAAAELQQVAAAAVPESSVQAATEDGVSIAVTDATQQQQQARPTQTVRGVQSTDA